MCDLMICGHPQEVSAQKLRAPFPSLVSLTPMPWKPIFGVGTVVARLSRRPCDCGTEFGCWLPHEAPDPASHAKGPPKRAAGWSAAKLARWEADRRAVAERNARNVRNREDYTPHALPRWVDFLHHATTTAGTFHLLKRWVGDGSADRPVREVQVVALHDLDVRLLANVVHDTDYRFVVR